MKNLRRICKSKERGDLELQENNYTNRENGQRCYSCGQNLGHYMRDYSTSCTINGIRYLEEDRTVIEKIWWAICITLSLCCGLWYVVRSYERWESSPVIVSFSTTETPVWQLPFPAVTICPLPKISSSVYNYTDYLHRALLDVPMTNEEKEKLGYMNMFCDSKYRFEYPAFTGEEMIEFFDETRSKILENAFDCQFDNKVFGDCSSMFIPILTDEGICYSFNLMDRTQMLSDRVIHYKNFHEENKSYAWSIENGFSNFASYWTLPRRAYGGGDQHALQIRMNIQTNDTDYSCGGELKGFKVFIGHPYIMPKKTQQHFIVPLGTTVRVAVSPEITKTSKEVKRYNPKERNCYLSYERPLKYFKVYTQSNCNIECQTNLTVRTCRCAKFYMPRQEGTPICGPGQHTCLRSVNILSFLDEKATKTYSARQKKSDYSGCGCLPDCTSMNYNMETGQMTWDWRNKFKSVKNSKVDIYDKNLDMALLQVFFKSDRFITSERNELYSSPEFVANVGGLLGLFVGFTAISLVEIIYYSSLRIICNIYMFGKGNWSGKID